MVGKSRLSRTGKPTASRSPIHDFDRDSCKKSTYLYSADDGDLARKMPALGTYRGGRSRARRRYCHRNIVLAYE